MNINATFSKNQIANIKHRCSEEGIEIRVEGTRLHVGDYDGPPLLDHDGCDPDLRKLVNKELQKRGIEPGEGGWGNDVEAAVAVIKNYQKLAEVAAVLNRAGETQKAEASFTHEQEDAL